MNKVAEIEQTQNQIDCLRLMAKQAFESKNYPNMSEMTLLNLMLSAKDLGISPMKAINGGFHVVNGKVCMSTALMTDRIRKAGHSVKVIEMTREKCVIIGVRKDNGDSIKYEYTMEDAALAGLPNSPTWKKYPKVMLYNRCMSGVARILFVDVVGNSYSEDERHDIKGTPIEERPLEDQEEDMVIDVPQPITEPERLTEEQCAVIDSYLQDDKEAEEKIKKLKKLESIYDLDPKSFTGLMEFLKKRKEIKEDAKSKVA